MWRADLRARLLLAVAGLAAASWVALFAWGASPYARYLHHEYQPATVAAWLAALVLFLAGWLLMSTAMMLPTTVRLLERFACVVARRPDGLRLQSALVAGFLATWLATGYCLRTFDAFVHLLVDATPWLGRHPQVIAAAVLASAAAFEVTPLKHRCLAACRSPQSFVYRHWGRGRPMRDAFRIGVTYGTSCVGCCWALMLVMFGVGMVNVVWMLALATVMTLEKSAPGGAALRWPVALALLGGATSMLL